MIIQNTYGYNIIEIKYSDTWLTYSNTAEQVNNNLEQNGKREP